MFRKLIATAVACLTAALAWGQGPVVKWQPFTLANPFAMIFNIKNK